MKVIKFGAIWCPGCIVMKPRWLEIEKENSWLKTEYHDFDSEKDFVQKYNINDKLPTFVFLDDNEAEFLRLSGEVSKKELLRIITENKNR